jgi:hypothetical protein
LSYHQFTSSTIGYLKAPKDMRDPAENAIHIVLQQCILFFFFRSVPGLSHQHCYCGTTHAIGYAIPVRRIECRSLQTVQCRRSALRLCVPRSLMPCQHTEAQSVHGRAYCTWESLSFLIPLWKGTSPRNSEHKNRDKETKTSGNINQKRFVHQNLCRTYLSRSSTQR